MVLFLDGDTILHPAFVSQSLEQFRNPEVAIVWGHRREIATGDSFFNRVLDLDWISPAGITDYCGGDALIRRDVLEQTHGYNEMLIAGEEPEMCRRIRGLGYKILHVDLPMTGPDLAMKSWKQYWRRATRTGYAYAEVSERFRSSDMPFWDKEAHDNRVRAIILMALPLGGILLSAVLKSWWPLIAVLGLLTLLVLRTAAKAGWKSQDSVTRILYGMHSHMQQIPILWGQLQYAQDRRSGQKRGLIEYKDEAS
jgi:hypothetical protein